MEEPLYRFLPPCKEYGFVLFVSGDGVMFGANSGQAEGKDGAGAEDPWEENGGRIVVSERRFRTRSAAHWMVQDGKVAV
jgi:hypothetical protein